MAAQDLYKTLGVSKTASASDIKKAYRALAKESHPDVNPDDAGAEAKFKEVTGAYEVLSDEQRRKNYDEFGDVSLSQSFDAEQARAYQQYQRPGPGRRGGNPFGGGASPFGRGSDDAWLNDLFGFGGQGARRPAKGRDIQSEVRVDFMTSALGGKKTLQFEGGRSIQVRIPSGVEDGEKLRLKGQGSPGGQGAASGDLLLTIRVLADNTWRRDGLDLHIDIPVTILEAIKGGGVEVPTLTGKVNVKVPAGSQSGRTLRLKGKGIERKSKGKGDLYVHLLVQVPVCDMTPELEAALDVIERHYDPAPRQSTDARDAS